MHNLITHYTLKTCYDTCTLQKDYQLHQHEGCYKIVQIQDILFYWFVIGTCKLQDNIIM